MNTLNDRSPHRWNDEDEQLICRECIALEIARIVCVPLAAGASGSLGIITGTFSSVGTSL